MCFFWSAQTGAGRAGRIARMVDAPSRTPMYAPRYLRDGFLPESMLDRAGRRYIDDGLPAIVAAIKGADPDITLQAICDRLEAIRERTPRGRSSWQPSSVKMLLERAERLGLLSK